ncbi:MAG: biopolymer transporter ExbD [Leptospira sp.]|nr:biopolymer transporter ExbD [Leptospira sp.]
MKIRKAKKNTELQISSLIDVLFILLIFLMLAVSFTKVDTFFNMELPETNENWKGGGESSLEIGLLSSGQIVLFGEVIDFQKAEILIPSVKSENPKPVFFVVDKEASFSNFLRLSEILKKKGYKEVSIQETYKNKSLP